MTRLIEVRNLVAIALDELGFDPDDVKRDKNTWFIGKGSVGGMIQLLEFPEAPERSLLSVAGLIMTVPTPKALPFFRRLLELNNNLCGEGAFGVDDDNGIWLQSARPILNIDLPQVTSLVVSTLSMADYYDDLLLDEFGREYSIDRSVPPDATTSTSA